MTLHEVSYYGPGTVEIQPACEPTDFVAWPLADSRHALPRRFVARLSLDAVPYGIELLVELKDRQPVITQLNLLRGCVDLNASGLRDVHPTDLLKLATISALSSLDFHVQDKRTISLDDWDALFDRQVPPGRHRRSAIDNDDDLREVARVYMGAIHAAHAPTKAVERHFGMSRPTAQRRIKLARERAYITSASG